MKKILVALMIALTITSALNAQLRKVPAAVTEAFKTKFSSASQVEWKDRIINFEASFLQDGITKTAQFTKEGTWVETTSTMAFSGLPAAVQDGFKKSKYADWEIKTITVVEESKKSTTYKVYVKKDDIQKRNLFFNKTGKLLKDNITV